MPVLGVDRRAAEVAAIGRARTRGSRRRATRLREAAKSTHRRCRPPRHQASATSNTRSSRRRSGTGSSCASPSAARPARGRSNVLPHAAQVRSGPRARPRAVSRRTRRSGRGRRGTVPSTFATTSSTPSSSSVRNVPGSIPAACSSRCQPGALAARHPACHRERLPHRLRLGDALDLEAEQVRRGVVDRLLDRELERRGRGRAAVAVADQPQVRDPVLEPQQLDVAAVRLHVRAHARERLPAPASRAAPGTGRGSA